MKILVSQTSQNSYNFTLNLYVGYPCYTVVWSVMTLLIGHEVEKSTSIQVQLSDVKSCISRKLCGE